MNLEKYKGDYLKYLSDLISIASVYQEGSKYPFGEEVYKCGIKMQEIMKELGFNMVIEPEGRYGYAEIGEGELFGVLGHLDVVPAKKEDGWNTEPFTLTVIDDMLYGRGTSDDKGPTLTTIFAVKALLDDGYKFNKRLRFIFGFDEENKWECMNAYVKNEEIPTMGFTPDSAFPCVHAEKGLLQIELISENKSCFNFAGGESWNAVPSSSSCKYDEKVENALLKLGHDYTIKGDMIVTQGKGAHAKNPWLGESAVYNMVDAIEEAGYTDNNIAFISKCIKNKHKFEGFSTTDLSDLSGPLTVNLGKTLIKDNCSSLCLDLRLPVTLEYEKAVAIVTEEAAKYGFTPKVHDWMKSIYLPLDSDVVTIMMDSYREVTGDVTSEAKISGGATYARAFDNCIAFGPNFPGEPTTEHNPNECIKMSNVMKSMEIYYKTIRKLCTEKV